MGFDEVLGDRLEGWCGAATMAAGACRGRLPLARAHRKGRRMEGGGGASAAESCDGTIRRAEGRYNTMVQYDGVLFL